MKEIKAGSDLIRALRSFGSSFIFPFFGKSFQLAFTAEANKEREELFERNSNPLKKEYNGEK